jgi:hypothetical protein
MNIRRIGIAGVLAALALNAWAGPGGAPSAKVKFDVTGTWNATVTSGTAPPTNLVFVLKQEGDKLTGTVAANGAAPVEISDARVLRSSIYFTVNLMAMAGGGGPPGMGGRGGRGGMGGMGGMGAMVTKFTGSLSGDELKLTSQMQMPARGGDAPTGTNMPKTEMVATRQ